MKNLAKSVNLPPRQFAAAGFLTVVSGLPRSGTSLMMQMLAAGGLPALSDGVRLADESNPRGYLEHERVKRLRAETDFAWLWAARGQALKVIHLLLPALPPALPCRVILLRRPVAEVVASQRAMLRRQGRAGAALPDGRLGEILLVQLRQAEDWLTRQPGWRVHPVDYAALLADPLGQARAVGDFLESSLDVVMMAGAVDGTLRRQRVGSASI